MRWRYDAVGTALRVHVAPVVWNKADFLPTTGQTSTNAAEGF